MTTQVQINHGDDLENPEVTSSEARSSMSNAISSNDLDIVGTVKVQDGFGMRDVSDPSQLTGDEIVSVAGMTMKASMAAEMGLMDVVFAEAVAPEAEPYEPEASSSDTDGDPDSDFETVEGWLNDQIDSEHMTFEEASQYHTAVGQAELAGMNVDELLTIIDGLREGEINPMDISADHKQVAEATASSVRQAATMAAQAELGPQAFDAMATVAASNAQVAEVIRTYAIQRALGQAGDVTWSDLAENVRAYAAGELKAL